MNGNTKYELDSMRDAILNNVMNIKKNAIDIQKELDTVIQFANSVIDHTDDAIHFDIAVWENTSWRNLPMAIKETDTRVKAYQSMKRIIKELEVI